MLSLFNNITYTRAVILDTKHSSDKLTDIQLILFQSL